ncbi:hypothetical protein XELAEV_18035237mg [Xenopus laevis]|uniref:Uncharacterized protein n=1 Tax=Xenopus laevis TaxID=8355 RepID=A0A974CHJ9_XENLA|nr:hypothetical protein XELAEV_18035237mg [Xenopus laevis]
MPYIVILFISQTDFLQSAGSQLSDLPSLLNTCMDIPVKEYAFTSAIALDHYRAHKEQKMETCSCTYPIPSVLALSRNLQVAPTVVHKTQSIASCRWVCYLE